MTKLRAWWWHRQGLDGSLAGMKAADVLAQTGWARSIGGAAPYLTLFARAGLRRPEVDKALEKTDIHELPGARGCTWVIGKSDFALALAAGRPFADDELKVARRLGVTDKEIDQLCAAVKKALVQESLDPDALKKKLGDAVRSLGAEGQKKGLTTTLPVALGLLQSAGEIRRVPVNGRIDGQRYKYAAWKCEPKGSFTDLARRYFSWIGPAAVAEFQTFAGLGVRATKDAIEPLGLIEVEPGMFLLPEDRAHYEKFQPPRKPQYVLVSSLDGITHLRDDWKSLTEQADMTRNVAGHAILDRGRLVGRWEFDVETGTIAWLSFVPRDSAMEKAVKTTEAYVREDLGDLRSFSLDSPKSRAPRIAELRKLAASA